MFEPTLTFFPDLPRRSPDTPIRNFLRVQQFYLIAGPLSAIFGLLGALKSGKRRWQDWLTYGVWAAMIAGRTKLEGGKLVKGALQGSWVAQIGLEERI
jgi:hypothetical protein